MSRKPVPGPSNTTTTTSNINIGIYIDPHRSTKSVGRFTECFDFGQQRKASKRSKSQVERDEARIDIALHSLRSARQYCKLVNAAYTCESRQRHDAHKLYLQSTDSAMIELKQKYEYDKAKNKAQQKYDQARNEIRPEYDQARIELQQKHSQATIELQKKYNQARSELQQKQDQARIELQRKYEQASEQRKKSIRDSWSKAKQQHQQLSRSHRQTSSQYNQGLQELVDMTSYPSLLMNLRPTQSLLPDSVGGRSQERKKRVKHDNIKQEPADEKMSDVATTSTSFSTTTSPAPTTSTFSTSSSHTVSDVTLDMQYKLTFNPTTTTSQ
ncbi:hypothetical protein BGZ91_012060 [Linnemannia elongata]|nr:hypothetical protein BGZ91_012060 [Linnemannia elongata]